MEDNGDLVFWKVPPLWKCIPQTGVTSAVTGAITGTITGAITGKNTGTVTGGGVERKKSMEKATQTRAWREAVTKKKVARKVG